MTDQDQSEQSADTTDDVEATRDDGAHWYLDLLGVRPESSGPAEPARSQSNQATFLLEAPQASASTATPLERTDPIGVAPQTPVPQSDEALEDWAPQELAKQVHKRRIWPWVLLLFLLVISVAGFVAFRVYAPRIVEDMAVEEAADYRNVMELMQAELPDIQQTLATATEPSTSGIQLFDLVAQLSRMEATSSEVITRANRPLPETLPLLPRAPLEELEPTRSAMPALGAAGLNIVARINATIAYRTRLDDILMYPPLPHLADLNQINGLSLILAETLTASAGILAELPLDPAFETHRLQAAGAVESFDDWQRRYLEALRAGDTETVALLIDDVAEIREQLFQQLVPALAIVRAEVDQTIIGLNDDLSVTIRAIPR